MSTTKDLRDLMHKRIDGLKREAQKLSRQATAATDVRTRRYLRDIAKEAASKAKHMQQRYDKLFADKLDPEYEDYRKLG